ncbi:hypothetical protein OG432_18615 [Streptomyces sp. NBC_00442]|uniref:hypothetical protein n=1 Tax=Streptomyces sp. NBC_00442 TaxID=2903651 RepID=UPI002E251556
MEFAGRSQLGLLDDDQLAVVGYGLDVSQAALLVSGAEVVPLGAGIVECSAVRHGLCFNAFRVNYGNIVSAGARGRSSDIHK